MVIGQVQAHFEKRTTQRRLLLAQTDNWLNSVTTITMDCDAGDEDDWFESNVGFEILLVRNLQTIYYITFFYWPSVW